MIPGSANPLLLVSAAQAGGYAIERSLRFNSADSAYLSRTPSTAGNRKTWTWAGWVKRSGLASNYSLFSTEASSPYNIFGFQTDDSLRLEGTSPTVDLRTSVLFRDPSAWYHIILAVDTTQSTAADRIKLYANGSQITAFQTSTYPSQNDDFLINNTQAHSLCRWNATRYFPGYLADIHFCDGYAYDPSYFTEFDGNGILQPKAFTGSYGTNGFHLTFSDNSTAGSLGDDTSGNGNNWTVNNISVATGAGNDSMVDVPTNGAETDTGVGGEVRGNYCTWNPVNPTSIGDADYSLANGNLEVVNVLNAYGYIAGTMYVKSGKWYWEVKTTGAVNPAFDFVGMVATNSSISYPGNVTNAYWYKPNGNKVDDTGYTGFSYGASWSSANTIGVALDLDAGEVSFYKDGVSQGVAFTGITASAGWAPAVGDFSNALTLQSWVANFGQRQFAYASPAGFKAICTANLPSTTITTSGSYTGNGVADGPFVFLNGVPTAMTVDGNAVTFGTDADKLSNGFKIRTTSTTFNQNASTYNYSITSTGDPFKTARAQAN
jgi:hypothetical protein